MSYCDKTRYTQKTLLHPCQIYNNKEKSHHRCSIPFVDCTHIFSSYYFMDQDMHAARSASIHINLAALYFVVNHNVISIVHSGINNENQMSYIPYVTSGICYSYYTSICARTKMENKEFTPHIRLTIYQEGMHTQPPPQLEKSHFPFWLSILVTDVIMFCNVSFYGVYMCEVYICNLNLCCKLFSASIYPKPELARETFWSYFFGITTVVVVFTVCAFLLEVEEKS